MIDGGNNAVLVLLDLSAAFDTLDHMLLLQRLHAEIGLDGSALDWGDGSALDWGSHHTYHAGHSKSL